MTSWKETKGFVVVVIDDIVIGVACIDVVVAVVVVIVVVVDVDVVIDF
jgi:hypothetical protein